MPRELLIPVTIVDEILRQGGTVHFGKWVSAAMAQFVDDPRRERFAGTRFPEQQHRGPAGGHLFNHFVEYYMVGKQPRSVHDI